MNVKEAAQQGISHIVDLFQTENLTNVGLEEIVFDDRDGEWIVTVGFSRPWDYPERSAGLGAILNQGQQPKRSYKIVRIRDFDGEVIAVKNHQVDF